MQLIRKQPMLASGCVVTIGNFDGIHIGHQALMNRVVTLAQHYGVPACVLTFSPLPLEFFQQKDVPRILLLRDKLQYLAQMKVDFAWMIHFNEAFSQLTPRQFVEQYLLKSLNIRHMVVGEDFRFGAQRSGDVALLTTLLKQVNVPVECVSPTILFGKRVSSSWVRQTLSLGDFPLVEALLGRPYQLSGKVKRGTERGRILGFPTANVDLKKPLALQGVYAAWLKIEGTFEQFKAVVNVGVRPTFGGKRWILEAHLLDVTLDLYGKYITVAFAQKIRDEQKFASVSELTAQIAKDVNSARAWFHQCNTVGL